LHTSLDVGLIMKSYSFVLSHSHLSATLPATRSVPVFAISQTGLQPTKTTTIEKTKSINKLFILHSPVKVYKKHTYIKYDYFVMILSNIINKIMTILNGKKIRSFSIVKCDGSFLECLSN